VRTACPAPLPTERTTFVGRKAELETAKRVMASARLITLTGASGVGTSRLAIKLAEHVAHRVGEAEYIDLADGGEVPERASGLILLDNADRGTAVPERVAALLDASPDAVVLVASSVVLAIDGEHLVEVLPLSIPSRRTASTRAAIDSDAIRLFVERAKAVRPSVTQLTTAQLMVARDICASCDGLPAMIEVAAAAVRLMPLEEVRDALRTGVSVDLIPGADRHAARARAIVGNLDADEREVLDIGSALDESFGVECVVALAGGGAGAVRAFSRLVDRSVLIADTREPGTFRIPRTVRRILDAERVTVACETRIEQHVKSILDELARIPYGNPEMQLVRHLGHHRRTVERLFAEYATDPESSGELIRLVLRLRRYWGALGLKHKVDEWLEEALKCRRRVGALSAAALRTESYFAAMIGEFERASSLLAESLEIVDDRAEAFDELRPEFVEALIRMGEQDIDGAEALLQKAIELTKHEGRLDALEEQLHYFALASVMRGDYERAEQRLRSNVEWLRSRGNRWGVAYALIALSVTLLGRGLTERASETAREALQMMDALNDRVGVPTSLRLIAALSYRRGDASRAATLLAAANRMDPQRTITAQRALGGVEPGLRRALGPREYSRLSAKGRQLERAEFIALALGEEAATREVVQLTRRESEIAALLVEGLSSAQIATQLVLSTRTVEGHIQRMLNKLQFRSRSQIAVWMSERLDSVGGAVLAS